MRPRNTHVFPCLWSYFPLHSLFSSVPYILRGLLLYIATAMIWSHRNDLNLVPITETV